VSQADTPLDRLTPRQIEVLAGMAQGWSNRRIGVELRLSTRSVESIVSNIITNLDLREADDGMNPRVSSVLLYLQHAAFDIHGVGDRSGEPAK
jgi:DNA-binding NarL/FixJ family response regulator